MDRGLIGGNRNVSDRVRKLERIIHIEKIRNAEKAVDNGVPVAYSFPISRKAKEYRIEGKAS
jgi:hypothetical protein